MKITKLFEYLIDLNLKAAKELEKEQNKGMLNRISRLVFPKYEHGNNKNGRRISEQELRFIITNLLHKPTNHLDLYYSVETPTVESYSFSGKKSMSAATDLTLYNKNREKVCNCELKAHNPRKETFFKDVEKLVKEDVVGAWFHLLFNAKENTIKRINEKMIGGFKKHGKPKREFFFSSIIINQNVVISKKCFNPKDLKNPESVFCLEFNDFRNLPIGKHIVKDWQIDKF